MSLAPLLACLPNSSKEAGLAAPSASSPARARHIAPVHKFKGCGRWGTPGDTGLSNVILCMRVLYTGHNHGPPAEAPAVADRTACEVLARRCLQRCAPWRPLCAVAGRLVASSVLGDPPEEGRGSKGFGRLESAVGLRWKLSYSSVTAYKFHVDRRAAAAPAWDIALNAEDLPDLQEELGALLQLVLSSKGTRCMAAARFLAVTTGLLCMSLAWAPIWQLVVLHLNKATR